jgi:hypothetical protein
MDRKRIVIQRCPYTEYNRIVTPIGFKPFNQDRIEKGDVTTVMRETLEYNTWDDLFRILNGNMHMYNVIGVPGLQSIRDARIFFHSNSKDLVLPIIKSRAERGKKLMIEFKIGPEQNKYDSETLDFRIDGKTGKIFCCRAYIGDPAGLKNYTVVGDLGVRGHVYAAHDRKIIQV